MNIAITGGTGFVGSALTGYLTTLGHHVFILTRNSRNKQNTESITFVEWLNENACPEEHLPSLDAIINLAGATLNRRWTRPYKEKILHSRLQATKETIRLTQSLPQVPKVLINASAIGYYGTSTEHTFHEDSPPIDASFLHFVCREWEKEASEAVKLGIRTIYARFGLILDNKSGAFPKLLLPYQMFAGGPLGHGEQWYSWIHLRDVVESIYFLLHHEKCEGPVNITSPYPERMENFGKKLSKETNRPHWLRVPSKIVEKGLGDMSTLILEGQHVSPNRLISHGYTFTYPTVETAFKQLLHGR
ncbi:TIGR01777 family oxidoreductase [Alteribacillus iranensis]|nr:TIGR01777 family oxidoreductase [Alteribacillus iranensis]